MGVLRPSAQARDPNRSKINTASGNRLNVFRANECVSLTGCSQEEEEKEDLS